MTPAPVDFEMRRLESLSNTIFGVAMTLLAYDLPKAAQFDHLPDWRDLYHAFGGRVTGMVLSFVIRGIVMLNLLFLLSIILLPVTNALYGNYGVSSAVAVLYGLHLTVIAGLNALLWRLALGPGWQPEVIAVLLMPTISSPTVMFAREAGEGLRTAVTTAPVGVAGTCQPSARNAAEFLPQIFQTNGAA